MNRAEEAQDGTVDLRQDVSDWANPTTTLKEHYEQKSKHYLRFNC